MHLLPETISAYVDGELDADARKAARVHLDACAACRREVATVEKMAALFAAGAVEPGADFESRVLGKLRAMPLPRQTVWVRLRQIPLLIPAFSAAALVLIGVGGYAVREVQMRQGEEQLAAAAAFSEEELSVAEQADFLENVELLEELDALEALDDAVPG